MGMSVSDGLESVLVVTVDQYGTTFDPDRRSIHFRPVGDVGGPLAAVLDQGHTGLCRGNGTAEQSEYVKAGLEGPEHRYESTACALCAPTEGYTIQGSLAQVAL